MASTSLILHKGAREVSRQELERVPTPQASESYYPVPFHKFFDVTVENLKSAGFQPTKQQFALSRNDQRFFSVIELNSDLAQGVSLAVAISSAHDKSLPYRFIAGNRTLCCDNLMMSSDLCIGTVVRKHTRNGEKRMVEAISLATKKLPMFVTSEAVRIKNFQDHDVSDDRAAGLVVRAWEKDIISHAHVLPIFKEFKEPSFDEFSQTKSLYRLEQAFTTILGPIFAKRSPQRYAQTTIDILGLLGQAAGIRSAEISTQMSS